MKTNRTILITAEVAILAAFAVVLDLLAGILTGPLFPYGGSISIAIVPIMVVSFRRGLIPGIACGFLVGIIQTIYSGHILEPFQYIFDYPIAYTVIGLAGVFTYIQDGKLSKMNIIMGTIFAGILRYLSHFLAGVIFWSEYVPDSFGFMNANLTGFNAVTWSIFYNALYMIPTIILSTILSVLLYLYNKKIYTA